VQEALRSVRARLTRPETSMNLGIFSSMNGGPWGGSEELWAAAAAEALAAGHRVAVSMLRWRPRAAALDRLAAAGARICERRALRSRTVRRWVERVALHDRTFTSPPLEVLCICQGGTYDFLSGNHPGTLDALTAGGRVP